VPCPCGPVTGCACRQSTAPCQAVLERHAVVDVGSGQDEREPDAPMVGDEVVLGAPALRLRNSGRKPRLDGRPEFVGDQRRWRPFP
jgi:hypothetical protein